MPADRSTSVTSPNYAWLQVMKERRAVMKERIVSGSGRTVLSMALAVNQSGFWTHNTTWKYGPRRKPKRDGYIYIEIYIYVNANRDTVQN